MGTVARCCAQLALWIIVRDVHARGIAPFYILLCPSREACIPREVGQCRDMTSRHSLVRGEVAFNFFFCSSSHGLWMHFLFISSSAHGLWTRFQSRLPRAHMLSVCISCGELVHPPCCARWYTSGDWAVICRRLGTRVYRMCDHACGMSSVVGKKLV